MQRNYRDLIKRLNDGKNLETVLPEYANALSGLLYEYSLLQAALEFYSVKEMLEEEQSQDITSMVEHLQQWIEEVLATDENGTFREVHIQEIDAMRSDIMEKVELLALHADQLQIYEYVLNRKEYEFEDAKVSMSDERFAETLLTHIFQPKENVLINQRIQEAVSQLPVRMLRGKYFEYLKDSLYCYKEADKSSVDSFLYMLRTSALIYDTKNDKNEDAFYNDNIRILEEADYTCLSKLEFEECRKILKNLTIHLTAQSDVYQQIEKVINSFFVFLLVKPYVLTRNEKLEENCERIISITSAHLFSHFSKEMEKKLSELFDDIIGIQEKHIEEYLYLSGGLNMVQSELSDMVESYALNAQMQCLYTASKLCDNSIFIDIHKQPEDHQVTSDYLEYQLDHLIGDLTSFFKSHPQCINRAIMAATLSRLPVFFNNRDEVQQYVEMSLSGCKNEAEKLAAKELLLSLVAQEKDEN